MSETKPFASLSSGLLARKGAAKPAMRPQGFGQFGTGLEDLGWNDMGHAQSFGFHELEEPREHVPSSIAALTPAPKPMDGAADVDAETRHFEAYPNSPLASKSPVVEQQRTIAASFAAEQEEDEADVPRPVVVRATPVLSKPESAVIQPERAAVVAMPLRPRQAAGTKAKAAFTLRLNPETHLKLRLACAIRHRSAQQLVSEALDTFLKTLPELDALAEQVPAKAGRRN